MVDERETSYDGETIIERIGSENEIYLLYGSSDSPRIARDADYDPDKIINEFEERNGIIVIRLLRIFRSILDDNLDEEDVEIQAYKPLETGALERSLNQINWAGTATDVAGRLASNLILAHGLPNANHRTAIAMVQFYLQQIDESFSIPETSTAEYDWKEWVDEYIVQSKRIVTVRRKVHLFKHLREMGVDEIERKDGIAVVLDNSHL